MRDPLPVFLPHPDVQLAATGTLDAILFDIHVGKDFTIPYPIIPSPVGSDHPVFSASASMSGSSTSPPSLCENTEEHTHSPLSMSAFRRPALPPLSIVQAPPRYGSPWSPIDPPPASSSHRRGSLPTIALDHAVQDTRPFTAPQQHIYPLQSSWSDQDDLSRFAYNAYDSPSEEPPLSAFGTLSPVAPSPRTVDFPFGTPTFEEDVSRSRPSTRGELEYPAYIPDCRETINAEVPQQYLVDPSVVLRPMGSSQPRMETKSSSNQLIQPSETIADTSRTITPLPLVVRKRSSTREKFRASPIIETFKDGVVPPIKRRGKLPKETTELLKQWLYEHAQHPYPTEEEKRHLCAVTGLTFNQVSNWMINARRRILPAKNAANAGSLSGARLSPVPRTCSGPSPSGSPNEHYQSIDHPISGHSPHQNTPSTPGLWECQPRSSLAPHSSPNNAFYAHNHLQSYPTSNGPSIHSEHLVGCVTTSQFLPYGLNGGGNPFNYHGSMDANILSRTSIDSKQYLDQAYSSAFDRIQELKREQVVEPML